MKNMRVFHVGGNLGYLRKKKIVLEKTPMQPLAYSTKYRNHYLNSPQLSNEQLQQMMQVVEDIRLNCNNKYL